MNHLWKIAAVDTARIFTKAAQTPNHTSSKGCVSQKVSER